MSLSLKLQAIWLFLFTREHDLKWPTRSYEIMMASYIWFQHYFMDGIYGALVDYLTNGQWQNFFNIGLNKLLKTQSSFRWFETLWLMPRQCDIVETNWDIMTHICVSEYGGHTTGNCLTLVRRQAFIKTNINLFSVGPLEINTFQWIWTKIPYYSHTKIMDL